MLHEILCAEVGGAFQWAGAPLPPRLKHLDVLRHCWGGGLAEGGGRERGAEREELVSYALKPLPPRLVRLNVLRHCWGAGVPRS